MTNPAKNSAADGAAMRHILTVQAEPLPPITPDSHCPAADDAGEALDAARWRALTRIGRITMQGSAGVDPHTGERRNGSNVHFGAEFWPDPVDEAFRAKHPESAARYDRDTRWGIACLKAMADVIIERDRAPQPPSEATHDGEERS